MKPQTFMNNSGEAVREAADFYKIPTSNIIVIFDDISLQPGKIRIRQKGSDGGHNGIKSIIYHLNSNEFPRIKIGVGAKPNPEYDLADWVLGNIAKEDTEATVKTIEKAYSALPYMVDGNIEKAMPIKAVKNCTVPIFFVHGENDTFVPCEMSRLNFEACPTKKLLHTVKGADHGLAFPVDPDGYIKNLNGFFY